MGTPALEELLLVTPPMLWLDEIVSRGPNSLRCRLTPRSAHPFAEQGGVEPLVSLAWMEQAAAALAALRAHELGQTAVARRLASVTEAQLRAQPFALDRALFIDAEEISPNEFACAVLDGDQRLVSARVRLCEHTPGS